jgi:hypothetical protein
MVWAMALPSIMVALCSDGEAILSKRSDGWDLLEWSNETMSSLTVVDHDSEFETEPANDSTRPLKFTKI